MATAAVTFVGPGKVRTMDSVGTWTGYTSLSSNTAAQIEGTGCLSEKVSNTTIQGYGVTAADWTGEPWDFSSGQANDGDHIFCWLYIYEGWDSLANGGFRIRIADDLATDSVGTWYVGPQPGFLGGWYSYVINPAADFNEVTAGTANWTTTGNPAQLTGIDGFGSGWKVNKTIFGAVDNCFMDAMVIGKGYRVTGGDGADADATFDTFSTYEETNRFGPLRTQSGILFARCKLYIGGTGSENTTFTQNGFTIVWEKAVLSDGTSSAVASDYYSLILDKGTGNTTVTLSNGSLSAVDPHEIYLDFSGASTATLTNVNVSKARLIDVDSAVSWTGGQIVNSGLMTLNSAATLTNLSFISGNDTAQLKATSAAYFNNCSNLSFTSSGTGHAIEITSADTYTFDNFSFSGYAASDGSTGNEAVYINAASGTFTIYADSSFSVRIAAGTATATVIAGSVTTSITVTDTSDSPISGAQVIALATSGGNMPVNATVTISRSGSTATVTHTSHAMSTNDKVQIKYADQLEYNGVFTITVSDANTYTYTVSGTPASPATTSTNIKATYVAIYGTTDSNGNPPSMSRVFSVDQPISGRVRKSTSAPYYKTSTFTGIIDSASGFNTTVQLLPDQ